MKHKKLLEMAQVWAPLTVEVKKEGRTFNAYKRISKKQWAKHIERYKDRKRYA